MKLNGRSLHLIGIGGAGMSGLALVAARLGANVSGSDRAESSYTKMLVSAGIGVSIGHDAANLPEGNAADIVISTAIDEANVELAAARQRGLRVIHRSDLLAEFVAAKNRCIAVAGAHGKTTTTAMIAHCLSGIGADPAFFVGGEVEIAGQKSNARWGEGDVAVVEADESDRSFLKLTPQIAVVTNIELDHHSTWHGGIKELTDAFRQFVEPAESCVYWRDQKTAATVCAGERAVAFAIESRSAMVSLPNAAAPRGSAAGSRPGFLARDVRPPTAIGAPTTFDLIHGDAEIPVELAVNGEHNVLNALAALAAIASAGFDVVAAAQQLASFGGVGRRFEAVGTSSQGARIYSDYAHHPTELRAALTAARASAVGDGRLVAVFQPHLYSRTEAFGREFGRALALADIAVVLDVYPARELAEDFPGVTGWQVAAATADARPGMAVHYEPRDDDAQSALARILRPNDLCLAIGAGTIHELALRLASE